MNMPSEKAEQGMTVPDEPEKDRLRQIILDSFSYEFVQPLNLISLNREYLQLHLQQNGQAYSVQEVKAALDGIGTAVAQLDRLTENCRDLMKCLRGTAYLRKEPVCLSALLEDLCCCSAEIAHSLGITLQYVPAQTGYCVMTDRAMAERVLLNLISNALQACRNQGTVQLRFSGSADGGTITVTDDGIGVAPEFAAHAFDPRRAEKPSGGGFPGGAGLGLYLCGEYCRLLNWQPTMRAEEHRTTVLIRIPQNQLVPEGRLVFHSDGPREGGPAERTRERVLRELRAVPGLEALQPEC
jgi:signal transduction histidine kinase